MYHATYLFSVLTMNGSEFSGAEQGSLFHVVLEQLCFWMTVPEFTTWKEQTEVSSLVIYTAHSIYAFKIRQYSYKAACMAKKNEYSIYIPLNIQL